MSRCRALSLVVVVLLLFASAGVVAAQQSPEVQPSDESLPVAAVHAGPNSLYPDPSLTPGAIFDDIAADQICVPGYATNVRDVTSGERAQVYAEYGMPDVPGTHEVDHFVPLELGGSNAIANLWPEPYTVPGAHEKDRVENYLHEQVCSGALALGDAQQLIETDWYAVYATLAAASPTPAPSATAAPVAPPTAAAPQSSGVSFASVIGGSPGGRASVTVQAAPGATCYVDYVTPLGTPSTAQGQGRNASHTVGQDGTAIWSWNIGPSTRAGAGTVTATCSTGTATTPITIS